MQASKFEFSNPHMTHASFEINEGYSNSGEEVQMPIHIDTKHAMNESGVEAIVAIVVSVGGDSAEFPFFASMTYTADFRWEDGAFTEDTLKTLLSHNAPALLLGYTRPALANLTGFSKYPAYNLPFIDLTKEN